MGIKVQFFHGVFEGFAFGVAFDFAVKLCGLKFLVHIGFEFAEAEAVCCKAAQRFIKRGRYIPHFENNADECAFLRFWGFGRG